MVKLLLLPLLSYFSHVRLFVTLWTIACQAPLSMGFSQPECWSDLPCPPPGDLPNPGTEPRSPTLQVDSLPSEPIYPSPGELSDSGIEPGSPALQVDSLPAELPRRPRNLSKFYPNKVSVLPPHQFSSVQSLSRV